MEYGVLRIIPSVAVRVSWLCVRFVRFVSGGRERKSGLFPVSAVSGVLIGGWLGKRMGLGWFWDDFGMVRDGISVVCRARSVTFASSPSLTLLKHSPAGVPTPDVRVEVGGCERTYPRGGHLAVHHPMYRV